LNGSNQFPIVTFKHRIAGWVVHIFTASGACVGLLALVAIHHNEWLKALFLMGLTIVIDAVDGFLARLIKIKTILPRVDGALLDNLVDFFTYVLVPAFFLLLYPSLLPPSLSDICVFVIVLSAAYQFTQVDAKTEDHFFKGFPSYWNIVVFYLFFWQMNLYVNLAILLVLAVLSFVPIKYVYPTRLEYLTHSHTAQTIMLATTWIWGAATFGLIWTYPQSNLILTIISMCYIIFYSIVSIYRTCVPLASSS
jgi:phosphatidylcholine synthase